ncbi:hypothetical protein BKI52_36725 [marine bacterium AO1-C]|nr:hypothetical protein BKI52_36725 [marine bacterium AO1-C]
MLTLPLANAQSLPKSKSDKIIDSLTQTLTGTLLPKKRVDVYNQLARQFRRTTLIEAAKYADKALKLAKKHGYREGIADAYFQQGLISIRRKSLKESMAIFKQVLQIAQECNYRKGKIKAYFGMGKALERRTNFSQALKYFQRVIKINEQWRIERRDSTNSSIGTYYLGMTYRGIARTLLRQLKYDESEIFLKKALKVAEETNDLELLALTYQELGNVRSRQGRGPQGLYYLLKALEIYKSLAAPARISFINNVIGSLYLNLDLLDKAEKFYLKSYHMISTYASIPINHKAHLLEDMAYLYYKKGKYELTIKYANQAQEIRKKGLWPKGFIGASYNKLGKSTEAVEILREVVQGAKQRNQPYTEHFFRPYLGQALINAKKFAEAKEVLTKSFENIQQRNLIRSKPLILRELARLYKAQGQLKKSWYYKDMYLELKDSLFRYHNAQQVLVIKQEILAETAAKTKEQDLIRKQLEIEKQQIEVKQRTTLLVIFALVTILILLALFQVIKSRRTQVKYNQLLAGQNEQLTSLSHFKQQMMGMIVHDLKNPLNAIIGLSEKQPDPKFTSINQAGKQMQVLVTNILDVQRMEEDKMVLQKEVVAIDSLLHDVQEQVQLITRDKNLKVYLHSLPDVYIKVDTELISRVLINLLSNAIKYTPQNGSIHVSVETSGAHTCKVLVTDTGIGIAPEYLGKIFDRFQQALPSAEGFIRATGLGLTFCKLAVETHGGKIGVKSTQGAGSTFWFTLPTVKTTTTDKVPEPLLIKTDYQVKLTPREQEVLLPLATQIQQYQIYETTNICKVLKLIDEQSSASLQDWKTQVEESMYTWNEAKFRKLLTEI